MHKIANEVEPSVELQVESGADARYKHFFFNNSALACFASLEGYFEELNENFTRVLGYTTEDLLDKRFTEFIHPDDIDSTLKEISNLSIGIDTVRFVNRYRTKSNTYRYLEWNSTVNKKTNKIYGIARDVTESRLAEKNLAEEKLDKKQQAERLMEAMEALAIQNEDKGKRQEELVIANKELEFQNQEKEKRAAELSIANVELIFQNREKERRAEELIVANKELAFQNNEKEKRAAELSIANAELDFQNAEKGKRAAELLLANECLERAKNDIRKLNEVLEQKVIERTAQLEFANKELESFSYSVSHDLRAPLRALSGNATILKNDYADKFDEEGGKFLQSIIRNSKKMGVLIDDLLAFSKLGRKQVAVSEINMNAIIRLTTEPLLADTGNGPEFEIADLLPAAGDPSLVKQVWVNLISNAIKYSKLKLKTIIKIGAYSDGAFVTYFVRDNGAGFDMKYYDKLFGVFQRLHSQEEFEGTGIGLAIVHKIISRHHGKVWAESTLGEGSTFYFSLPAINNRIQL